MLRTVLRPLNQPLLHNSRIARSCALASVICLAGLVAACSNQAQSRNGPFGGPGAGLSESGPVTPGTSRDFKVNIGSTVHFTVNSKDLSADAQATLRAQTQWLKRYPQFTITIEGHADERGTREYNIALGAQRAESVRRFLTGMGVRPARMRTISYGKERPVATCNDISCWSQNRRAETKLNRRAGS